MPHFSLFTVQQNGGTSSFLSSQSPICQSLPLSMLGDLYNLVLLSLEVTLLIYLTSLPVMGTFLCWIISWEVQLSPMLGISLPALNQRVPKIVSRRVKEAASETLSQKNPWRNKGKQWLSTVACVLFLSRLLLKTD